MNNDLRQTTVNKLKPSLVNYGENCRDFLNVGRKIDATLQSNTEILSDMRKRFDSLSATVELEFEGISVFDHEIKKANDLLQQSISTFNESVSISGRISEDLDNITNIFEKISNEGIQLGEIIKNINIVSESIEVASRNAGITAFHAGRQGRGFEIIAREMTGLVKSSQKPTRLIPEVSEGIQNGINELAEDLKKIREIITYLKEIAEKFANVNNELLSFIPDIDVSIKDISSSVAAQKNLHGALLKENERLPKHLEDVSGFARSAAATEIFLAAFFQNVNNIKDELLNANDDASFYHIYNAFKTVLENAPDVEEKFQKSLLVDSFEKFEVQSSDRFILQFVSEANHLNEIIEAIVNKVKSWIKTDRFAHEVLAKGKLFYEDIYEILSSLHKKIISIKDLTNRIDRPLQELKKITERSKLLGLYAGIESARSGEYALSLGVVTKEIKALSQKTADFVTWIDEIESEMAKDFSMLVSLFVRGMSDVEQGIGSLQTSISAVDESMKVLENLDALAREMLNSTSEMVTQCRFIGEKIRAFNDDYRQVGEEFNLYVDSIKTSNELVQQILGILNECDKDVAIIKRKSKTVVYRETADPIILDPANKTDATSHQVIEQVFTGLLTFDQSNNLLPGIVESFSVSSDGRQWDFFIKKDIRFQNGEAVSTRDVANSLVRAKAGPNASFIDYIDECVVVDKYHMKFVLKYPFIPFLSNLACGVSDVTPLGFTAEAPIGCGPYRFVEWKKNDRIVLEAFEDFFDGRPVIDRVEIRTIPENREAAELFKKGEISIMQLTSDIAREFPREQIVSGPVLSTQYVSINVSLDTPLKDRRVRQAMNYAIDKDYYTRFIMQGQAIPGYGVFPPGMSVFNKELAGYHCDLRRAKELMKEAGYGSGVQDIFVFDIREGEEVFKRADFIRESLSKIGLTVKLNPLPWKEFLEKCYSGKSILSLRGWVSDNGDPDNFMYTLFHSRSFGAAGNTSFYANDSIDRLIEMARAEQVAKRRTETYQKMEMALLEDAPWIFLSHGVDSYVVQKNIGGFKVDPFGLVRFRFLWSS